MSGSDVGTRVRKKNTHARPRTCSHMLAGTSPPHLPPFWFSSALHPPSHLHNCALGGVVRDEGRLGNVRRNGGHVDDRSTPAYRVVSSGPTHNATRCCCGMAARHERIARDSRGISGGTKGEVCGREKHAEEVKRTTNLSAYFPPLRIQGRENLVQLA